MKNIGILAIAIITMIFLSSCSGLDLSKVSDEDMERIADKAIVCNAPYMRFGTGCCLDQNSNAICDNDESLEASEKNFETDVEEGEVETGEETVKENQEEVKTATEKKSPSFSSSFDLSEFPDFLILKGTDVFDGVIVIGDDNSAGAFNGAYDIIDELSAEGYNVGSLKTASDILGDEFSLNLITIGNPCENDVTASIMGNPKNCDSGFEKGKAFIRLYENGDNIAVVVAGGNSDDTWVAANMLLEPDKYGIKGSETILITEGKLSNFWTEPEVTGDEPEEAYKPKQPLSSSVDLSNYPDFFGNVENVLNAIMVVYDDPQEAMPYAIIGQALSDEGFEIGSGKTPNQVSDPFGINLITMGNPCENAVTASIMGNPKVCDAGFVSGKGMIRIVQNGDYVAVVVAGKDRKDTWEASKILANHDKYNLKGTTIYTDTASKSVIPEDEYWGEGEAEAEAESE